MRAYGALQHLRHERKSIERAIESEFEKILIITHLEDLRDRFPMRIEVSKTPQGSTYAVR